MTSIDCCRCLAAVVGTAETNGIKTIDVGITNAGEARKKEKREEPHLFVSLLLPRFGGPTFSLFFFSFFLLPPNPSVSLADCTTTCCCCCWWWCRCCCCCCVYSLRSKSRFLVLSFFSSSPLVPLGQGEHFFPPSSASFLAILSMPSSTE